MSNSILTFHNPGLIDIRGATVAGLSAKSDELTAIGKFGTGLKYAIAWILAQGGQITIHSGEDVHEFSKDPIDFRGKAHDQVIMQAGNSQPIPLGFTTHYGHQWQAWQIFRELYANAVDEGGDVVQGRHAPTSTSTTIIVACRQLLEPFNDREDIILPATCRYDATTPDAFIMNRASSYLFYRGVRVAQAQATLTWNFRKDVDLTEDRTLQGLWTVTSRAGRIAKNLTDATIIHKIINAPKGSFEHDLAFNDWDDTSPEFIDAAERAYRLNPERHTRLVNVLKAHRPAILAPSPIQLSPMRQRMLDRAVALVERMGMHPADYPISVADLGSGILGQYNKALGTIMLSPMVFEQGTKQVLSTLYEELVHAETGKDDCCYDMQTFLFNQIVSMYEEHVFGEPV